MAGRIPWIDLDGAIITIPAKAMKGKKTQKLSNPPHIVPLATQSIAILREVQVATGGGHYVFPSLQTANRPMSENTVNVALRRMGYDRDTATAHGFRAMGRTMAAERLGISPDVIDAQLAHAVPDSLGRAYNRTTYAEQLQKWADYLDKLVRGEDGAPSRPTEPSLAQS